MHKRGFVMRAALLLTGSVIWALSEIIKLFGANSYGVVTTAAGLGFAMMAIGITFLWEERDGRVGLRGALIALGLGYALKAAYEFARIPTVTQTFDYGDGLILFGFVALVVMAGSITLAIWLFTRTELPRWMGALLLVGTTGATICSFGPESWQVWALPFRLMNAAALAEIAISVNLLQGEAQARGIRTPH